MKKLFLTMVLGALTLSASALTIDDLTGTYVAKRTATEYFLLTGEDATSQIDDTYLVNAVAGEGENTITFKYFLNYEHYSGVESEYENITGTVDFNNMTITFQPQRSVRNRSNKFVATDGTSAVVAKISADCVITFDDWTVAGGGYTYFTDAKVTLTPNPSVDLFCGMRTADIDEYIGYDSWGDKDLTKWQKYSWIDDLDVENLGDNKINIPDFLGWGLESFIVGEVNWKNMTVEIPVTDLLGFSLASTNGFDFSGDVVKDADGNPVKSTLYYMTELKPIVGIIKPDMTIDIEGVLCYDYGEEYGICCMYYIYASIHDLEELDKSYEVLLGDYTVHKFSGKDKGMLNKDNTDWTDFNYTDQWTASCLSYGQYVYFEGIFAPENEDDYIYFDYDEDAAEIAFYTDAFDGEVEFLPYVDGKPGEDNVVAKISEDGTITIPQSCLVDATTQEVVTIIDEIVLVKGGAGVNDIKTDADNGAVEYYNLKGIKVAKPAPGQVIIKRTGSKATKIFAK